MVKTGEMDWKRYYREERSSRSGEIEKWIGEYLSSDDPVVDRILRSGGALSFPHTHLEHSMIPVIRTAAGILRGGYDRIIALGVFHRMSGSREEDEFSLDGFREIMNTAVEINGRDAPKISEYYLPRKGDSLEDLEGTISRLSYLGEEIAGDMTDRTVLVMTGDLVHYGHGYGTPDPSEDPKEIIDRWIVEDLDEVYLKKDFGSYLPGSARRMSDHGAVAITASTILGSDLRYSIISSETADYSKILNVPSPTVVAAVFYGVYPE